MIVQDHCHVDCHHTIIPQISVRLSVCPSVRRFCPSISNRSHDALRARPMCARNPTMCPFFLSFYGYGKVIQLNDFVWCSLAFIANVVVGFRRRCRKKKISANNRARGLPFNQKLHRLSKTGHQTLLDTHT